MKHVFADQDFAVRHIEAPRGEAWDQPDIIRAAFSVDALLRSKLLILSSVVLCLVLAAAYLAVRPDRFIARTSIIVGGNIASPPAKRALLQAEGELQTLLDNRNRLLARIARLESETRGDEVIQFPPSLLEQGENPVVANILNGEKLIHDARRETLATTLQSLRQLRDFTTSEVAALSEQVRYAQEQQASIDQEVGVIRELSRKGLAPANRLSDLERTAATFATRRIEVETRLLDRQQDIYTTDQKIADATNTVRNSALVDLQQSRAELRATEFQVTGYVTADATAPADGAALANYIEVIKSDATARGLAQQLDLGSQQTFYTRASLLPFGSGGSDIEPGTPEALDAARRTIQSNLIVERIAPGSRLDISYEAGDRQTALRVAGTLAEQLTARGDQGSAMSTAQIVRAPNLSRPGPSASAILAAAVFLGLALGAGQAFLLRYVRLAAAQSRPGTQAAA
jgi:uncharacterized protein involved in exopolysaccharide biosynthesis